MKNEKLTSCECGQLSFIPLYQFGNKTGCHNCYQAWKAKAKKVIKMSFATHCNDGEFIYLPLTDNLENDNLKSGIELVNKWLGIEWGFCAKPDVIEITTLEESGIKLKSFETMQCSEFDIYFYKELGTFVDLYDSPFDESPRVVGFSSYFAYDCYRGSVYSKDFSYFYCQDCNREICEQSPQNGWHSQVRYINSEPICLRCYESDILKNGIDIESVENGELPGMFLDDSDLTDAGYEKHNDYVVGYGHSGPYHSEKPVIDEILKLDQQGFLIVINYDELSIGGLGGYIEVWKQSKTKAIDDVIDTANRIVNSNQVEKLEC